MRSAYNRVRVGRFSDGKSVYRQDFPGDSRSVFAFDLEENATELWLVSIDDDGSVLLPGICSGSHRSPSIGVDFGRRLRGFTRAVGLSMSLDQVNDDDHVVGDWNLFTSGHPDAVGERMFVPDEWIACGARTRGSREAVKRSKKRIDVNSEDLLAYLREMLAGWSVKERQKPPLLATKTDLPANGRTFVAERPEIPFWLRINWFFRTRLETDSFDVGLMDIYGPSSALELDRLHQPLLEHSNSFHSMWEIFWRNVMKIRPESEREEWEKENVAPCTLLLPNASEVELYRALGETMPIFWRWDAFVAWTESR